MIICIAWDLVGKYNHLIDVTHEIFMLNGRVAYHSATPIQNDEGVRVERINNASSDKLRVIRRYLRPDDPVKLVPIAKVSSLSEVIEIPLNKYGVKHIGKYTAIVDTIDADLAEFHWSVKFCSQTQHAKRTPIRNGKSIHLHRVILERVLNRSLEPHEQVDHINGNGLDNRRENLRLATHLQNKANTRRRSDNTSGYKGVSRDKKGQKWYARIVYNNKLMYLGRFDTPEEAHAAYCKKAVELHGEFANYGDES